MADIFNEREKGYEAKFKLDSELQFKAISRGNKMLAEWLGQKFGMGADERQAYGKELAMADLDKPGHDDLLDKIMKDAATRKVQIDRAAVEKEMQRCHAVALQQLVQEQGRK
jgi:hypothetical protein